MITDPSIGLTECEVKHRIEKNLLNIDTSVKPLSVSEIFRKNFFTLFNFINFVLAILIMFAGFFDNLKNLLFMVIVISNSLISFFQELRAKSAIEKLKIVASNNIKSLRDSKIVSVKTEDVVKDDILIFSAGDQIVADCLILEGNCEVNESLLTGESNLISKSVNDNLYSGSFIVSGNVKACAIKVGKDTHSAKISKKLKNIESSKSEIMISIKKIIKIVSIVIIPVSIPLFLGQMKITNNDYSSAILSTSSILIGMIPEGLALLTSSVLALGATRLSKKKILAKDIYSIESLARIDTLCLDKTGTITEGVFEVIGTVSYKNLQDESVKIGNYGDSRLFNALEILSFAFESGNETFMAIKNKFYVPNCKYEIKSVIPFSSERKFSSVYVNGLGSFIMGSAESIFEKNFKNMENLVSKYYDYRILSVSYLKNEINKNSSIDNSEFLGIVLLRDKIRKGVVETIDYFKKNNVEVKIISGDNPKTISSIAKMIGIRNCDKFTDSTSLKTHSDIMNSIRKYSIFARATPDKKKDIVECLKLRGHCVAMVGDGVNDVLALKEADCSISIASGSAAAREISNLILIDSSFSSMKDAVFEGRRAINNVQTTSSLFLSKTIYSTILTIILLIFPIKSPFMPIHMSLLSSLTAGIPAFLLALEPNTSKIEESIFSNMFKTSFPVALTICINIICCFMAKSAFSISNEVYSTISVITTGILGFRLLWEMCQPISIFKTTIFLTLSCTFITAITLYGEKFSLAPIGYWNLGNIIILAFLILISNLLFNALFSKPHKCSNPV